ncbi:hypothetical protein H0A36_14050 [Endozoicomonas sp. SM1973]|uniref:Uncharacterized protein n=1 Tax=Spartinivicinus marinus TaxID=2994442 RepID=A0A853I3F2_9GAMM|nr:hypothetical protein [Spartinivicinus marinus]MCX4028596.1 hypothetical protein [Spartinivicinus marinus]NYZ67139.1 hypothetical protein [Spartinivicinus marinus]
MKKLLIAASLSLMVCTHANAGWDDNSGSGYTVNTVIIEGNEDATWYNVTLLPSISTTQPSCQQPFIELNASTPKGKHLYAALLLAKVTSSKLSVHLDLSNCQNGGRARFGSISFM